MTDAERMCEHPTSRFGGETHAYNLVEELQILRDEPRPAGGGHRQITMVQRGMVTQMLFSFDAGAELPTHAAHGVVIIQALEGRLMVLANDRDHELLPGCMLVLNTDMPHDVRALEESAMLLTVHLYL